MPSFPNRLKELRKAKGVTHKTMVDYLGVGLRTYQHYEYGDREPNFETLTKLADYFEVSTDYLLGRSDNPNRQ